MYIVFEALVPHHPLFLLLYHLSCRLVSEDAEYGLWTVTIFRKMVDDFKNAARDRKCVP